MSSQSVQAVDRNVVAKATHVPAGRTLSLRRVLPIYLFILPASVLFLLWNLYPLGDAFVMSFFHWNLVLPSQFIGQFAHVGS